MARKISLQKYIAANNPNGAKEVLKRYQLPQFEIEAQIEAGLSSIINKYPEQGLTDMVKLAHPDLALFKEVLETKKEVVTEATPVNKVADVVVEKATATEVPVVDKSKEKIIIYSVLGLIGFLILVSIVKD